jgi:hypothetical protein
VNIPTVREFLQRWSLVRKYDPNMEPQRVINQLIVDRAAEATMAAKAAAA